MKRRWDFRSMSFFEQRSPPEQSASSPPQQQQQIDDDNDEHQQGEGRGTRAEGGSQSTGDDLFQQVSHSVHRLERFSVSRHITEFVLNANVEEPDEVLRGAFQILMERAIQNAEQQSGRKVLKIGVTLQGRGLHDPIVLPLRPPEQNSCDTLMAELDKLGQSDGEDGGVGVGENRGEALDKRSLLLSEPVQITVTCLTPPTGAGRPRFYPYQHWGYNETHRIRIRDWEDNYCMFHALIAARACHDPVLFNEWMLADQHQNPQQQNMARLTLMHDFCETKEAFRRLIINRELMCSSVHRLMHAAGLPEGQHAYGMDHLQTVQDYWDQRFPALYRIVLFEDHPEELPKPIWKGPSGRRFDVVLFLSNAHYDGIRKINCFFKLGNFYCVDCECSYGRPLKHTLECIRRCPQCAKIGPDHPCAKEPGVKILCPACNRFFFSQRCYHDHQGQTCSLLKRCNCCWRVYQRDPKRPHKCFTKYCTRCKVYHGKDTGCFIKKQRIPLEKQRYRIVCWDTETRLEPMGDGHQKAHKVNFLSARVSCTDCADLVHQDENGDCEICKNEEGVVERSKYWSETEGDEPVAGFVEWMMTAWSEKFDTYIWAHNASRFDGHFVLRYLGETRRRPDVVMNGLKIFEFRLQHSAVNSFLIWRDSCLLFPIRLDGLKSTFDLDCPDKPFFPYGFNRRENYEIRLPHLPPKEAYFPGSMKPAKLEKFEQWYEVNRHTPFFLPEELRDYCENDTEILMLAILKFRQILLRDITNGLDVLPISCTIASVCMNIFRTMFMKENQLAIVPETGYERNDRASVLAIKYLDWIAKSEGVQVQHAGNGREKRIKNYKLDGWIAEQNKCIEVLGCYWHGCERCYDPGDKLVDGKTCRELNESTQDRLTKLREPDEYQRCIEECEINALLSDPRNRQMREFFDDLGNERGPIDPRAAYCGGRTGPLKLFAEASDDEKISVYDIVSLYPWVNYDTNYPVGIPKIIHPSVEEIMVDWNSPDDLLYRGLYRVRVIPPRALRIPILPLKMDDRLLFCCCHRCASKFRHMGTRRAHQCEHTDEQRAYTGTYTHIELARALECGYRVDRFWRAWHYEQWSDKIFKEYVRLMIKLKVEASGFPDAVATDQDRQMFADEYMRRYNVELDLARINKNPGLRFISKLMLNSLCMRNELGANRVITKPQEFYKLILDHKVEIYAIIPLSDEVIRVSYRTKKNFIDEHSSSNIVLSLWTTSRARLKLLDYMQEVHNTEGAELLYTDTDSVIVKHRRDLAPLQTGEFLGQMSEEYTGFSIKSFVCGGAKQYALKMVDERTGEIKYVQKIRGITFDVQNSQTLQFEHFRQKVLNYGHQGEEPAVFHYDKIQPTRASQIVTREQLKRYLPVCQKGIITDELDVLPFGQEMSSDNMDNTQCKTDKEKILKQEEKGQGEEKGEGEIVFLGMTINETPKDEKKELPPSTSSGDSRKRRHSFDGSATSMLGAMMKAQGESRAEWLDVLEKKYSKLEEEMGVDDNASDVVDFGEDSLDTILKKVERSEEKVRDWEAAHCSNAIDSHRERAQSSSTESEAEVTDDDSGDDDEEEQTAN
ncbi:hypothetical protein niasHT_036657 [Heterodera trifolii]|uniref:DNA-directed DNA polymerase n=1 Tax=Heterodera trifolii TaxID=157864 RepID=A0ABD2HZX3_9BILA